MKTSIKILLLVAVFSASCSKYGGVSLNYPTPPLLIMPPDVHTLAVINRSLSPPDQRKIKVIESILTAEVAGSDKLASDDALKGVFDRINGWRGINVVIPARTHYYGTGTRQTPELLDWNLVKQICDSSKADALLVLEMFDSNTDLLANEINNGVSAIMHGTAPQAARQIRVNVQCFWRLYRPSDKKIIDEFEVSNFMKFDAGGGLVPIPPPDGLQRVARAAGVQYIQRFLPSYYSVRRTMYKRGKGRERQQFLAAFRMAEVADWPSALPIWQRISQTGRRKNAGRACLNAAVANEVLGNINEAMMWAKKGYVDYRNKLCRNYQNNLSYRLNIEY